MWTMTTLLVSTAELTNLLSVVAVLLCFCAMILFITRNMMVLRVHGDDFVFTNSIHEVPPRIPQMNMMKVHIPFTFKLLETSKSSYSEILLLAMLGAIMSCTSYLMFVYNPLQLIVKKVLQLTPGSIFLNMWSDPPLEVLIDIYIFNVTNAQEFLDGTEKLKFQQIGPYVYQEYLTNNNATFNENGTMTFYPKRDLKFRRDLSAGDPLEDRVLSPNIPLIGISASLNDESFMKNLAVAGASMSVRAPQFVNLTIFEYLWGYDDPLVSLANNILPNWIDFGRFGILDRLFALDNATNVVTMNIHPELNLASNILNEEERSKANHIHRWNGSPGLPQWGYREPEGNETVETNTRCMMVEGAFDGTTFAKNMGQNSSFKVYRRAFCRPVLMNFNGINYTKEGVEGHTYRVDKLFLATPEENPENACYCPKTGCLPKGLSSLAPCYYGIPIAISQPHFFNSDPKLLENVDGMEPDETLHDSTLLIHPKMGVPLNAHLRIQINLDVGQTKYNAKTRPFNNLVLPLFWLQMRIEDVPSVVQIADTYLFYVLPIVQKVLIYLLGLCGLALISGSALAQLLFSREQPNGRLSFSSRGDYSPIPILPINRKYFKPDLRISK